MFSKNIKILSLFLILAVVMIGALGAVSAGTPASDGTVNATVNSATTNAVNATTTDTGASGTISGTVVTTTDSNHSEIPSGSAVTGITTPTLNSSKIFTYNGTYNEVAGATATGLKDFTMNTTTGVFTNTLSLTNSLNNLKTGTTYYIAIDLPAATATSADGAYAATVNVTNPYYLSFLYNAPQIVLDNNATTVTIGNNNWSYSGTVYNADGTVMKNAIVSVTVNAVTKTVTTGDSGRFTVYSTNYANQTTTGNKTIDFAVNQLKTTATLSVEAIALNIKAALNQTTTSYGVPVNLTAALYYANGTIANLSGQTITVKALGTNGQANTTTLTINDNGTFINDKYANTFEPGTYYLTLTATKDNYTINSTVLTLIVNKVDTTVVANPTTVYTNPDATNNIIKLTTNTTTNVTSVSGKFSYLVYDANGYLVKSVPAGSSVAGVDSIDVGQLSKGTYSVVITWTPDDTAAYSTSTVTVPVVVKNTLTITANPTSITYDYGTTGNTTYVNLTASQPINGTVTVYNGNKTLGTATLTNGKGTFDFGALSLAADTYNNITFGYAGDDTYNPYNTTAITVTVNPVQIGTLRTNTTSVTVNLTSDNIIKLNLTNQTKATQLIDYTGNVVYYVAGVEKGNVSMVNGVANVPVTSLKGLSAGSNAVTFKILNNVSSNTVSVSVTTVVINTAIVTKNITTNNATPITVTGTVTNATEGTVTVTINNGSNTIATLTNVPVAADGSFAASFGTLANGNYTATIAYTSTSGLSAASTADINVTVNGTAPTPTPVGNITTVLTLNNFTEVVGAGQNLTGTLTDVNGTPIVGQHIALNLTNPRTGASKIYWVTTDTDGAFQLAINLAVGTYTASASYAGNSYDNVNFTAAGPVAGTITVTSNVTPSNKTATVLTAENYVANATGGNFTGILTANGTPLVGQHITLNLTRLSNGMSKLYYATTDTDGAYQLEINLGAGNYTVAVTYAGTSVYDAASANGTIVMTRA